MRRRIFPLLSALFGLLLLALPSTAAEDILQTGSLTLPVSLGAESGRLEISPGTTLQLPRPTANPYSSLVATSDAWIAAATERDEEGVERLLVARALRGGEVETLRPPKRQQGFMRQSPVLLVDGSRLTGIAWLEGDERGALEVRAARWTGRRFRGVHRVAPVGVGSQLALTGAVLADGSWLLAWTAFDGMDDEIQWVRRSAKRWSRPVSVAADNQVPDITPALATCGTGAVLAWSRYDGNDYRLQMAYFENGSWQTPRTIGAAGSLYPAFVSSPDEGPHLVYRVASSEGWKALTVDGTGTPVLEGEVAPAPRQRPVLSASPDGEMTFHFGAKESDSTEITATWQPSRQDEAP